MKTFITNFFFASPTIAIAQAIWNYFMGYTYTLIGMTPEGFSGDAYKLIKDTIYPWFLAIGIFLMNIFIFIGFIRQMMNLRENVTMEMWIELIIKFLIANTLMANGLSLMDDFFTASSKLSSKILTTEPISIYSTDASIKSLIDNVNGQITIIPMLIQIIYLAIVATTAISILLTVLARYMNCYILMTFAPISLSTWAGGRGVENSAYAWIKTFLGNVLEIVAIAVVLRIGGAIITSNILLDGLDSGLKKYIFSDIDKTLISMVEVLFLGTSVKSIDKLVKQALALH
jgi:hypothetical protein